MVCGRRESQEGQENPPCDAKVSADGDEHGEEDGEAELESVLLTPRWALTQWILFSALWP